MKLLPSADESRLSVQVIMKVKNKTKQNIYIYLRKSFKSVSNVTWPSFKPHLAYIHVAPQEHMVSMQNVLFTPEVRLTGSKRR